MSAPLTSPARAEISDPSAPAPSSPPDRLKHAACWHGWAGLILQGIYITFLSMASALAFAQDETTAESVVELRTQGRFEEAAHLLRKQLEDRREASDATWHELWDIENEATYLQRFAEMPAPVRAELTEAERAEQQMLVRYGEGDYAQADSLARRALSLREPHVATNDRTLVDGYAWIGICEQQMGRAQDCVASMQRSLEIAHQLLPQSHPNLAEAIGRVASALEDVGEYEESLLLYEESLAIKLDVYGDSHASVATTMNNLGHLYQSMGDGERALAAYKSATRIARATEGADVAAGLSNLARLLADAGDLAEAALLAREALAIDLANLGGDHPNVAISMNNLARILRKQGRYEEAQPLYAGARDILLKRVGPEHRATRVVTVNLAIMAHDRLSRWPGEDDTARLARVEELYREVLASMKASEDVDELDLATVKNSLGDLLRLAGRSKEAVVYLEEALEIRRRRLGPYHGDVATTLTNWAIAMESLGLPRAESLYREAVAVHQVVQGEEHPQTAKGLFEYGTSLLNAGSYVRAESVLTRAADIFERARLRVGSGWERSTFMRSPYLALGHAQLETENLDAAWASFERSQARTLSELIEASRSRVRDEADTAREDSLLAELGTIESRLLALRSESEQAEPEEILALERQRHTAETTWARFQAEMAQKYPHEASTVVTLDELQACLDERTAAVGWVTYKEKYEPTRYRSRAWIVRDRGGVRWVELDARPASEDPRRRALALREDLVRQGPASTARGRLVESSGQPTAPTTHDLWRELFAPLEPELKGVESLIVAHAPPFGLPLEALTDDDGRYLGERFLISYTPSATVFVRLGRRVVRETSRVRALLVGDPPFQRDVEGAEMASAESEQSGMAAATRAGGDALVALPALPGTRVEVETVAALVNEPRTLVGADATERAIWDLARTGALQDFAIVHLATHALLDPTHPEMSALVLSQRDRSDLVEAALTGERAFDGLVTAAEVVREWKLGADLVVLSACETALGKRVVGEGFVGLMSAFLQAGAQSVLASLWKVDDRATSLLMERFYQNYLAMRLGSPHAKTGALREAQRWLRSYEEAGQRPFAHPYFWSGFVLVGR